MWLQHGEGAEAATQHGCPWAVGRVLGVQGEVSSNVLDTSITYWVLTALLSARPQLAVHTVEACHSGLIGNSGFLDPPDLVLNNNSSPAGLRQIEVLVLPSPVHSKLVFLLTTVIGCVAGWHGKQPCDPLGLGAKRGGSEAASWQSSGNMPGPGALQCYWCWCCYCCVCSGCGKGG